MTDGTSANRWPLPPWWHTLLSLQKAFSPSHQGRDQDLNSCFRSLSVSNTTITWQHPSSEKITCFLTFKFLTALNNTTFDVRICPIGICLFLLFVLSVSVTVWYEIWLRLKFKLKTACTSACKLLPVYGKNTSISLEFIPIWCCFICL